MPTSRSPLRPSEPSGNDPIPARTLGYVRARNKHHLFDMLRAEFKKSGITQKDLCARLGGKDPSIVSRILGAPSNMELDSIADMVFAMTGGIVKQEVYYPCVEHRFKDIGRQDERGVCIHCGAIYGLNDD